MTDTPHKPKKPWWKHLIYLAIGLAIGFAYKDAAPDLTRLHPARPIVLELYTSLGCPECPPADKLLDELAKSLGDRVLPLSFHVTNLDSASWHDPFAAPDFDRRQGFYHHLQGQSYTPQLVIEGTRSMQGAETGYIKQQILAASKTLPAVPLALIRSEGQVCIKLAGTATEPDAELWIVGYQPSATGKAPNGTSHPLRNIVHFLAAVPNWSLGERCVSAPPEWHYAAILQQAGRGAVLSAAVESAF